MSVLSLRRHDRLWDRKEAFAQFATACVKRSLALAQRAGRLRPKFFESQLEIDPCFDDLVSTFSDSRLAFDNAEELFWKLRVQNEELKEQLLVVQLENTLLREQLKIT